MSGQTKGNIGGVGTLTADLIQVKSGDNYVSLKTYIEKIVDADYIKGIVNSAYIKGVIHTTYIVNRLVGQEIKPAKVTADYVVANKTVQANEGLYYKTSDGRKRNIATHKHSFSKKIALNHNHPIYEGSSNTGGMSGDQEKTISGDTSTVKY